MIKRLLGVSPALASFTVIYFVGFSALAYRNGNQEFLFYAVCMGLIIAAVVLAHRWTRFSPGLLWAMSFWGLLHFAGGNLKVGDDVLYNLWIVRLDSRSPILKFDQVVHAYGFAVAAVASWQCLRLSLPAGSKMTWGLCLGVWLMGMGLGAANEVVEFIATLLVPNTNVGGYENTGWDLVFNGLGSGLAALTICLAHRRR